MRTGPAPQFAIVDISDDIIQFFLHLFKGSISEGFLLSSQKSAIVFPSSECGFSATDLNKKILTYSLTYLRILIWTLTYVKITVRHQIFLFSQKTFNDLSLSSFFLTLRNLVFFRPGYLVLEIFTLLKLLSYPSSRIFTLLLTNSIFPFEHFLMLLQRLT